MTNKDNLEAGEKMSQLEKIVKGWQVYPTSDIAYQVPLTGKTMPDVGKCRLVLEFASLSDAEKMLGECCMRGIQPFVGIFLMDSIAQRGVPDERTFIVRNEDALPEQWRLQKITVNVTPAGS